MPNFLVFTATGANQCSGFAGVKCNARIKEYCSQECRPKLPLSLGMSAQLALARRVQRVTT